MLDKRRHCRETVYLLFIQSKQISPSTKKPKTQDVEDVAQYREGETRLWVWVKKTLSLYNKGQIGPVL